MRNIVIGEDLVVRQILGEETNASGTSLQETLVVDYCDLVKTFGNPNAETDGYKVDAEWHIQTPAGLATIYNYKTGKNYLGNEGLEVDEIEDWHIGAKSSKPAMWVLRALLKNC